jgi:hypothetical protein
MMKNSNSFLSVLQHGTLRTSPTCALARFGGIGEDGALSFSSIRARGS